MTALLEVIDVTRAWKDADYRATLTDDQLATLPTNPIGELRPVEIDELEASVSSIAISAISPASCWFTLACTGSCCAW